MENILIVVIVLICLFAFGRHFLRPTIYYRADRITKPEDRDVDLYNRNIFALAGQHIRLVMDRTELDKLQAKYGMTGANNYIMRKRFPWSEPTVLTEPPTPDAVASFVESGVGGKAPFELVFK
jgi:hypothetical protein